MLVLLQTITICLLSFIPPLTADEQVAMSRVKDDGPLIESSSLDILINHVKSWKAGLVAGDDLPAPPLDSMMHRPDQYHGELFLITGKLLRRDRNPLKRGDIEAWIILPESSEDHSTTVRDYSIALLLPADSFDDEQLAHLPVTIRVPARFFARLSVPGQSPDHGEISLPLFVGSFPQVVTSPATSASTISRNTVIIVFLLIAASIWIIIRVLSARASKNTNRKIITHSSYDEGLPPSPPLPEEPAEALHILHEHSHNS